MNFEFSFGIGGKLGETIERAIFRSAERKEELNRIRHEVDMARERQQLAQYGESKPGKPASLEDAFKNWKNAMRSTPEGNEILEIVGTYYGGLKHRMPFFYVGQSAKEVAARFVNNEKNRSDTGRYTAEKIEKLAEKIN